MGTRFFGHPVLEGNFFTPIFFYAEILLRRIYLRRNFFTPNYHFTPKTFFTPIFYANIFFTSIFFYANIFLRQYFFTLKSSGFFRFRFSPVQPGINLHITKHILVRYKNIDTKIDSTKAVIFIFCQIYDA